MNEHAKFAQEIISPSLPWWMGLLLGVTVICSWYFVDSFGRFGESIEKRALLMTASVAAASIDGSEVAGLKGSSDDLNTHAFQQVRDSLQRIRIATPQSQFTYLMALRNADVILLADAKPEGSADYSPGGEVYAEASPTLRGVFVTGIAAIEGPLTDHWGEWVSGLAPVRDPKTGKVAAIVKIDISGKNWRARIAQFHWFGAAISGFLAAIVATFSLLLFFRIQLGEKLEIANRIVLSSKTSLYRLGPKAPFPLIFVSQNIRRYGYEAEALLAAPDTWTPLIAQDDRAAISENMNSLADGRSAHERQEFRLKRSDGTYVWLVSEAVALRDKSGQLTAIEGILTDITELKEANEKLRFANTLLSTEMETSPDGILVVDQNGRIISFNRRFGIMWEIPENVLGAGDDAPILASVIAAMKDPVAFEARVQHLYAHPEETGHDELETKDGRFFERHTAALRTEAGQYLGRVWFFRDITLRRRAEDKIRHTERHDLLTGLANRRVFMEEVRKAINRARRGEKRFAVLYMDLDHFKDVNDTLGHPIGDALLCAVAERIESTVRQTDFVARFGGDEFAVITTGVDEPDDAVILAERLMAAIGQPFSIRGHDIRCGVSIGIAVYQIGDDDPEMLLSHADVALYRAKSDGRSGYRFFTDVMDSDVRTRVTLIAELREAIMSEQLLLQYQPQVEIETGRIVGVEALVRWHHLQRGILAPDEFIHVAESSGLIVPLERWVLREACRQAKAWLDANITPIVMSVNISGVQFKTPLQLEKDVATVLAMTGLPPQLLALELTESIFMEASREHMDVVLRLRQSGVNLAIDDFGTGYSSFAYLNRYPSAHVKIAQEFVRLISVDSGSAAIVRATIGLCRELGMTSVAEGVETAEQLMLLRSWGCGQVQGFYFSRPLGPEDLLPLLRLGMIPAPQPGATKAAI